MIIDISYPLHSELPRYPGLDPFELDWRRTLEKGDGVNVSRICMAAHVGTHLDAPLHYLPGGRAVDSIDLRCLMGLAKVIDVAGAEYITKSVLDTHSLKETKIILLKTSDSSGRYHKGFDPDYTYLTKEAAEWLIAQGVSVVGIDSWSVDKYRDPSKPVHKLLLGAGVLILEHLALGGVPSGLYTLVALPLNMVGAEASPVRAILLPPEVSEALEAAWK